MSSKAKRSCVDRLALASLAPAAKPAARQQQANLHTLEVTVSNMFLDGPGGAVYSGWRAVVADGNSIAAGLPAKYHGLNTWTPNLSKHPNVHVPRN